MFQSLFVPDPIGCVVVAVVLVVVVVVVALVFSMAGHGKVAPTNVRVVVIGDAGTGKSTLIASAATESFPEHVPSVLPPTRLPADFYPDHIPMTLIDTKSSSEIAGSLADELRRAHAVVLTYACDRPLTLARLGTYWLKELRELEVNLPVILVGCKLDLRDENETVSLEQVMAPVMQQFREIETCIECSAATQIQVPDVFYHAQKAVLHPTSPLFDQEMQTLKPRCMRALKRVFVLCDHDRDGALNDEELNEFQVKCFNGPLQPAEIMGLKKVVQDKLPDGVNQHGLTLPGFIFLHALFIEKGRLETTWAVLRKFGYDNEIKLKDDSLPVPSKPAPDQSVELTNEALEFLRRIFRMFDTDNDGTLQIAALDELFSTAPESPWSDAPYADAFEKSALGGLSLDGFLSEWSLMTLLDPACSLENLLYIGYDGDPASAVRVTRKRSIDRRKKQTERNVFHCFVLGPKNAGKSALLSSFLRRPFIGNYTSTENDCYATNVVELLGGTKKTLILREIPEDKVKNLLSVKESFAACDVAVFVYDSSDEHSWRKAVELLVEVAGHGEEGGFRMPCLLIAAKDDLDPYPMAIQNSSRVCREMGIEAAIPVSVKLRDLNNIYSRIIYAAERPHLSIPETESGKSRKQIRHLMNRSFMFVSVGASVAIVGLAAYRAYAIRKDASS